MVRTPLRRVAVFGLCLALATPLLGAGPGVPPDRLSGAPAFVERLVRLWSRLGLPWWKGGCLVDPSGRCSTPEGGCGVDPSGRCSTTTTTEGGCGVDPNGQCVGGK